MSSPPPTLMGPTASSTTAPCGPAPTVAAGTERAGTQGRLASLTRPSGSSGPSVTRGDLVLTEPCVRSRKLKVWKFSHRCDKGEGPGAVIQGGQRAEFWKQDLQIPVLRDLEERPSGADEDSTRHEGGAPRMGVSGA